MTGDDDLRRKLKVLARRDEAYEDGRRVVSRAGLPTPLQALLTEIDETVLTRDLEFRFGESGSIVLVASGRRLLGVRQIDNLAAPAVAAQLAKAPIKGEADAHLKALIGVLLPLDLLSDTVSVVSQPSQWDGAESGTGVGVDKLAARLSIEYPFRPMTRAGLLLTRLDEIAEASVLRYESGEEATAGEDDAVDWIYDTAPAFLASVAPETPAPKLACLGRAVGGRRSLCVAFDGAESLIWVHDVDELPRIYQIWQEIFSA